MIDILRLPDDVKIQVRGGAVTDATVRFDLHDRQLDIYLKATADEPEFVCLRWNYRTDEPVRVMGDKWERSYGDITWGSLNGEYFMPWYFMADNGREVTGCGVMVQPNSFVCFEYDASGVCAWFDVRCGAVGVQLAGRELCIGTVVCEHYIGLSAFDATKAFCKVMCPHPILPDKPIYGGNNWYYAYGNSSGEEIRKDAALIADLCSENENPPFMVIDDGWEIHSVAGPWRPNERYGDMKQVADDFKAMGVRPGIWIRPLRDYEVAEQHPDWCFDRLIPGEDIRFMDPSHPEVKRYLADVLNTISGWGFELLKHDFTTFDCFGNWGFNLNGLIADRGDWHFYDRSKTSAEIILDLYRLIRKEARGMMILGCNTVSHLCAGLVEMSRCGDDTSGKTWSRTRAMGINTLAFRLPQNGTFYALDADCVGIMPDRIPWKLNRQWLDLLAHSGTPLFVSGHPAAMTDEVKADIRAAYRVNSVQTDVAIPLDWQYNNIPDHWLINGEEVRYDFVMDDYPALLYSHTQPN